MPSALRDLQAAFAAHIVGADQPGLVLQIAYYFEYYGQLARDNQMPFIVEAAAHDLGRLAWQMDMMRIYASGGGGRDLCQCARIAADHAAGRPRQKRAPVDADWLAAASSETLRLVTIRLATKRRSRSARAGA